MSFNMPHLPGDESEVPLFKDATSYCCSMLH